MRTAGRLSAPLIVLVVVACVFAASAQALSRFTYEQCDSAMVGGNPPSIEIHENPGVAYAPVQTCASPGGWVGIEQTGSVTESPAILETGILSTPSGWVESLTMTAFATNFHGNIGHVDEESWPVAGSGDNPRYFLVRTEPLTPFAISLGYNGGVSFNAVLGCSGTCEPGAAIGAHYIAALEVDPSPPKVTAVEGPLVDGGVLRGHQELRAAASDVGGGVSSLELKVNGMTMPGSASGACSVVTIENPSYKGVAATSPSPCPPTLPGSWDVDTSAAPFQNGANTIQVCASDFATTGLPNITCTNPQTVEVNNTCTESPVAGGADLSAGFADNGSEELTVKFGSDTEIKGGLTDQGGDPISGATICLESQPTGSTTAPQTVSTATTDSQGNFGLEVKPGANRQLLVGYRHDSFQVAKKLSLGTHAHPTIKLDKHTIKGGNKVEITGRLPNPAPANHVLELQGSSAHGRDWLTFKKVTTGEKGGYRTTYTFTKPQKTTRYRVRVMSPRQAGYDYEPGVSKPASIKVRR
jgi:hypothetical protein